MTSVADRIAGIRAAARAGALPAPQAIADLATVAQQRGGRAGRRGDGAFFTDQDVAAWLTRRAIRAALLDAAGVAEVDVERMLADGTDLDVALLDATSPPVARARALDRLASLRVLDPSCGAGAFLVAAWHELVAVQALLGAGDLVHPSQLHGVDIDPNAIAACRATLELIVGAEAGAAQLLVADAERGDVLPAADVLVGNPPFVRAIADARHVDLRTARVGNRAAWIVERALAAAAPGARAAFVLPIAVACVDAHAPLREVWASRCRTIHAAHFDTVPSSLFEGVVQRISLVEGHVRAGDDTQASARPARWWTTRYHRWRRAERDGLLDRVRHVPITHPEPGASLAKVGSPLEVALLDVLRAHPPAGRLFTREPARRADGGENCVHYKRRWSYFLLFTDFMPPIWDADGMLREPTEFKRLDIVQEVDARVLLAAFSSTLFWWYFSAFTDNRNVNRRDLAAFPLPELSAAAQVELAVLGGELMDALRACAEVRTCTYRSIGTVRNTYFRQGATRPVLDRIDAALAQHYGMDDAQLRFVLEFERRFRGGS